MASSKVKTGIPGFDKMLGGGLIRNSVTVVAGGTGSGRSTFISQFLVKGATDFGENGLFLSFDEQKGSIFPNLLSFGWDMPSLERDHKVVFIEYPQNELAAFTEQSSAIKELIDTLGIKRVVIDSITPFALLFSTNEERKLNSLKLFSAVKAWKATVMISAEDTPGHEDLFPHTVSGIESFADGFIHLSFRRVGTRRERGVEIVKMRGCNHEHELAMAQISEKGFSVGNAAKAAKKKVSLHGED